MLEHVRNSLQEAARALQGLGGDDKAQANIAKAAQWLVTTLREGGRVFACGNGGSMCDAMHFAEELSGKFRKERAPLAAMALSDPAHITCAANDYGYDTIFARQVTALARRGDLLLAISTSGNSPNILAAADAARRLGGRTIALTGRPASKLAVLADLEICTPGGTQWSDRIQELHIKVIHTLIELTERSLFPELY